MYDLRKYQITGYEFLMRTQYALLADEMGLGKTAQAITAAAMLGLSNMLIVCPASVKFAWPRQWEIWAPDMNCPPVVTYDTLSRNPEKYMRYYDLIIFDEAHYMKNPQAKRTKVCIGRSASLSVDADRVWMLTGTPVLNRPVELFPILAAFCPEKLGKNTKFFEYTKRYCKGHQGKWGWDATGASNIKELAALLDGFMLRRTITEVGEQIPENIVVVDRVETTAEMRELIKKEKLNSINSAEERHGIAKMKAPAVVEYAKELLESADKLVIWCWHRDVMQYIANELSAKTICGDTPINQREGILREFADNKDCRVLVAQIAAAGTGTDGMQTSCHTALFAEIDYAPKRIEQAISRLHRIGQRDVVRSYFLIVPDSIEEKIVSAIEYKESNIRVITGDIDKVGGENSSITRLKQPRKTRETEFNSFEKE